MSTAQAQKGTRWNETDDHVQAFALLHRWIYQYGHTCPATNTAHHHLASGALKLTDAFIEAMMA
jgi:hypothetical protein